MRWVRRESRSGLLFRDLSAVCGAAETTRGNSQEPDFRMRHHERPAEPGWRFRLHEIVFEAETRGGKLFDVLLLTAIVSSVAAVMLESVPSIRARHGAVLLGVEWGFTLLFSVEYAVRLVSVRYPSRYALSFFGVVDLLAIAPTYLSLLLPGSQALLVVRVLRMIRVFRILKLAHYLAGGEEIAQALRASRPKIVVFLASVVSIAVVMGALLYLIEGEANGFTSIPRGVYWAIVTMTTVGYGDISPGTVPGQVVAAVLMIAGYAIIAVPTGIVSVAIAQRAAHPVSTQACLACSAEGHDVDAAFCKYCGESLVPGREPQPVAGNGGSSGVAG